MKTKWVLGPLSFLLSIPLLADDSSEKISMRLLKPAFSFQLCVRNTVEAEIPHLRGYKGKVEEMEAALWAVVIKKCQTQLGDDEKGLMLLQYEGNSAKALGFYEGLVYSARAYVVSRSIDATRD